MKHDNSYGCNRYLLVSGRSPDTMRINQLIEIMGLFSALLGHASEINVEELEQEFASILIEDEEIHRAYKLIGDLVVFTSKRLILVNKQGLTGKKQEFQSIPYKNINRFSKETAGHFDLDAELRIWVKGQEEPMVKEFKKDKNIHEVYQVLSAYVLD